MAESDAVLARIERTSVVVCVAMAAAGWGAARGRIGVPIAVLAGGALAAISYRGIKAGIDAAAAKSGGGEGRRAAAGLVKFFTRYGILAAAAYVIMARLALPPVAVIAGASSLVIAVVVEALRSVKSRIGKG